MRLTKWKRQQIMNEMLNNTFTNVENMQNKKGEELFEWILVSVYGHEVIERVRSLSPLWFPSISTIYFRTLQGYSGTISVSESDAVELPYRFIRSGDHQPTKWNETYEVKDPELSTQLDDHLVAQEATFKRRRELGSKIMALLNTCQTTEKLSTVMPEAIDIAAKVLGPNAEVASTSLVVTATSILNEMEDIKACVA